MTTLVIIAKEPLPGKAKTRLHPPLSLHDAALVAAAAIQNTLEGLRGLPATRRVLLFDGERLPVGSDGYDVIPQTSGGLDERLAAIFDDLDGPVVLVGMDTPQVTAAHLLPAFLPGSDHIDAWFGPAADGGFWALGMREPRGDLIRGVPMSRDDTGDRQLARLHSAGMRVGMLATLTDVDTFDTALEVAGLIPSSSFARTLARLSAGLDTNVAAL